MAIKRDELAMLIFTRNASLLIERDKADPTLLTRAAELAYVAADEFLKVQKPPRPAGLLAD